MSKKATETGVNQDELKKALDVLDELDTSFKKSEDESGVDDLAKAVADAEKDLEALAKSADADGDENDKDGEDDKKEKDDKCEGKKKEKGAEPEPMDKSENDDFEALLLKSSNEATAAFEGLQKSVNDQVGSVSTEVTALRKSVESLLSLGVKQARVIGGLVKSIQDMGGKPVAPNSAKLGLGGKEEKLEKSNSDIQDLLEKAVNEDKISIDALSRFASHKVNGLSADEKQIVGL